MVLRAGEVSAGRPGSPVLVTPTANSHPWMTAERPPRRGCQARFSLGAIWGFTTAKDRFSRIGRIRKRRKSFRISVRSGFDSQALPPLDSQAGPDAGRYARSWQAIRPRLAGWVAGRAIPPRPWRVALSERTTSGESKGMTPAPGTEPCFVYILRCADGSYYIGCTTNLIERERAHNAGFASEHTARRRPVRLVYSEAHQSWSAARRREIQLKRWSHSKKKALVAGNTELLRRHAKRRRYAANSSKHPAD